MPGLSELYQNPALKPVAYEETRQQIVFEKMIWHDLEIKHS